MAAGGQGSAAVEHPDIVEPQEAALEDVHAVNVFAVDPPGEIEHQLVEHPLEEIEVARASPVDSKAAHASTGVDVAKGPLVGGGLAVGVLVPLPAEQHQLILGKLGVHRGQGRQWKARSHAANQGYSHLSGMESTRRC